MATNQHDKIYKLLAEKYKKPVAVIEKICRTQWEFTAKIMEEGSKHSIRHKYFGIFGVKKGRQEHFDNKDGNKEQEIDKQEPNNESK